MPCGECSPVTLRDQLWEIWPENCEMSKFQPFPPSFYGISGGVESETFSGPEFPANREKYREIQEFGSKLAVGFLYDAESGKVSPQQVRFARSPNRELSLTDQGITFP
jgi:hypothetical protein